MSAFDMLKAIAGGNPNFADELLEAQLETAKRMILNFCHLDSLPTELEAVQATLATHLLNRMGQEGSKSCSEGGISTSFDDLLTADIKSQLYAFRRFPKAVVSDAD